MLERPLVSVVVPAYNVERFLAETLRSVVRQTWRELEAIVVDDGSSDGTAGIADRFAAEDARVRVIHQENRGVSSARNVGTRAATGEFLCFLDGDDVFLPDKIERQVEFLRLSSSCDLVFSDFYTGSVDLVTSVLDCRRPPPMPMREIFVCLNWFGPPCSTLLRSRLQQRIGPFDETLRYSEDWDYWIRASRCGTMAYVPGPVATYRHHPGQATRHRDRFRAQHAQIIAKHFERGSRDWALARAAKHYLYAQWHYGSGEYGPMLAELARCAWYAQSLRNVRTIRQLLSR